MIFNNNSNNPKEIYIPWGINIYNNINVGFNIFNNIKMRYFNEIIHMGLGDETKKSCEFLIERLEDAMAISSGLQQGNGHISNSQIEEGRQDINDIIDDIKVALMGNPKKPEPTNVRIIPESKEPNKIK